MMLVQSKIGNLSNLDAAGKVIDWLQVEWYETRKRIIRKQTNGGMDMSIKFLDENPGLTEGDALYTDDTTIIAVSVLPCACIVIRPKNMFEMAAVCYEIGNKHL